MPSGRSALLPWALGATSLAVFAWVLSRIDYAAFFSALANASGAFVALVSVAVLFEQWVGAAKWRLLLAALGGARLSRVFAATHLLYAGLALGVWLGIAQYVLLMVLLGFVHMLARFVQIPGGGCSRQRSCSNSSAWTASARLRWR